jgi:hypothetical protein
LHRAPFGIKKVSKGRKDTAEHAYKKSKNVLYLETLVEPDYVIKELDRIATKNLKSNTN